MSTGTIAAVVVAVLIAGGGLWLLGLSLRRRTQPPGAHRPETVDPVEPYHRITYPHLYATYREFADRYGDSRDAVRYWVARKQRLAELVQRREVRLAHSAVERDYGWLRMWEDTAEWAVVQPRQMAQVQP